MEEIRSVSDRFDATEEQIRCIAWRILLCMAAVPGTQGFV